MYFFDINVALGAVDGSAAAGFLTAEDLLAEMKRLRIGGALVYHLDARRDLREGNRRLLEALRGQPSLFPCWLMSFPAMGGVGGIRPYVREGIDAGVRAFRLELPPREITAWGSFLEELLRALAGAEIPLLLEFQGDPRSDHLRFLGELLKRHPLLGLIVLGGRDAYGLLAQYGGLYAEYHDAPFPAELSSSASTLVSRLVFGSGMPVTPGECPIEQTLLSGLLPSEQQLLASGNAQRVLSIPDLPNLPALLVEPVRRPPGMVIDIAAAPGTADMLYGPDEDLTSTHRPGVHRAILDGVAGGSRSSGGPPPVAWDVYAGRLQAYVVVDPDFADLSQIEAAAESVPCAGLRVAGGVLSSEPADAVLTFADERALPVLLTPWTGRAGPGTGVGSEVSPSLLEDLTRRFPKVPFVWPGACRWDGKDREEERVLSLARDLPNLYLSVSGHAPHRDTLGALVDLVGSRKLMFGSEFRGDEGPSGLARRLGFITLGPIDYRDKMNILGGTAYRVYRPY